MIRTGIDLTSRAMSAGAVILMLGCAPSPSVEPTPEYDEGAARVTSEHGSAASASTGVQKRMRRDASFEDVLRGLPGVFVLGSGMNASVRVRGPGLRSGMPLFVVDGVTLPEGSRIANTLITPSDVAHVEVLRDVPSTSVWGERGSAGVIVITTKQKR